MGSVGGGVGGLCTLAAVTSTVVELAGIRLAALEAGVGGRPLLLVHGFTGAKEDFGDEVDRLASQGFHVVAPDLRGHGASDQPQEESDYSLSSFADDMWQLADLLGWRQFDLLGHSMGGMIAQVMVLDRPERVDRLILMDTHHGRLGRIDADLVALGIEMARTEGLAAIQAVLKMGADPIDSPAFHRVAAERPGYAEWSDSKMLACSPAMYAAMLALLESVPDRLEDLASVGSPTLVLVGELDEAFIAASDRIAAVVPQSELVVLPGGGHSPQFESTEAWRSAVDNFLARP